MADEKKVVEEQTTEVKATVIPETTDGPGRKIIRWILTGLVAMTTGVIGFIAGRASTKDDEENADEEEAPTEE